MSLLVIYYVYICFFKKIKGMGMYVVFDIFYLNIYIKLWFCCKYDVKDCLIFDLFYLLG